MQELTNPQSPEWLLNQVTLDAFVLALKK